jgi:integrase/recombinase XerD
MKALKEAVHDYLTLRRGLGFKLKKHSRLLDEFVAFLERVGTSHITSQLASAAERDYFHSTTRR